MWGGAGGGGGVPAVGMPVIEGLGPEVGAEEGVEDVAGRRGGGHGEIAARDPLAEAQEIGAQARLLGCEERAGAPEARGHLVADQEHVVASARLTDLAQI